MPQRKIVRSLHAAMLSRVLGNLMNNALKYSDGDLEICLKDTGIFCLLIRHPDWIRYRLPVYLIAFTRCIMQITQQASAWKSHGVYWSACMAASLQNMRKTGCASVYGCQILQRKHIPCESLATGESTCRGFQKTVL